jgi:hypothetical protein
MPRSEQKETRAPGGQALEMLDAFANVGAERFDITFIDMAGEKVGFRGNRALEQLRAAMPAILEEAAERHHNVIVRPRSSGATLIQLDDLGEDAAARLRPVSFLVQRTSPGSFQAWLARISHQGSERGGPWVRKGCSTNAFHSTKGQAL